MKKLRQKSSRRFKRGIEPVDPERVLAKVAALSIGEWSFKGSTDRECHVGPMAEDFHAVFALNGDSRHLYVGDATGVALAAIQGLNLIVENREAEIARQAEMISRLQVEMAQLRDRQGRLEALEEIVTGLMQAHTDAIDRASFR